MGIAFLVTSLVIVATPGTGAIYTIAAGLHRGRRASIIAALGCTVGIVPHLVAAVTGLAAVLYASAVAFSTIKYLGVAYLVFLAWQTWRDKVHQARLSAPAATVIRFWRPHNPRHEPPPGRIVTVSVLRGNATNPIQGGGMPRRRASQT